MIIGFALLIMLVLGTSIYQMKKLEEVHVLVNSRLSLALDEIQDLKKVVSSQQVQLDHERK